MNPLRVCWVPQEVSGAQLSSAGGLDVEPGGSVVVATMVVLAKWVPLI